MHQASLISHVQSPELVIKVSIELACHTKCSTQHAQLTCNTTCSTCLFVNRNACMQVCKAAHRAGLPASWKAFATRLCQEFPNKAQSWCSLADAAAESCEFKLAMAAYHQCWSMSQDAKVQQYCIQVCAFVLMEPFL